MADPAREIDVRGGSLRAHAARGTIVNTAFTVGFATLTLLRGLVVAAFLDPEDFGIWGIIVVALGTLAWLKQVGFQDKYVQQDEPDQEIAFQKAFTLELLANAALAVALLAVLPLAALVYGQSEILLPGLVCIALLPGQVLQVPVWIHYRRMDFVRQRALQAIDPVVGFVVAVALAAAGAGYWALVASMVAGALVAGVVIAATSPYPLRLRWDRATAREYFGFSWPLFAGGVGLLVMAQGTLIAASRSLGLAAVGALTIANTYSQYTHRVDEIVTATLYPGVCAVRDRLDVVRESFVKSNRLTLMWGMPFGIGLALFAADLVAFVIGERWAFAVGVIQATSAIAAFNHVAFNWTAYHRALDRTRPIAVASWLAVLVYGAIVIPLLIAEGLDGYIAGIVVAGAVHLAFRGYAMHRLLGGFDVLRHALRACLPTVPAAALVLLARVAEPWDRGPVVAAAELALYLAVVAAATWAVERDLLREAVGYLRRRAPASAASP